MRRSWHWLAVLALSLCGSTAFAGGKAGKGLVPAEAATCGEYGTSVHFEKTPSDAAKKALKDEKLVFLLHVSGNFEESEFT